MHDIGVAVGRGGPFSDSDAAINGSTASEVIHLSSDAAGSTGAVPAASTFGKQSDSSSTLSGSTQQTAGGTAPQLSSHPILGGPGTVQVQPLAFTGKGCLLPKGVKRKLVHWVVVTDCSATNAVNLVFTKQAQCIWFHQTSMMQQNHPAACAWSKCPHHYNTQSVTQ